MTAINKELYDALIEANVSDETATAAAQSDVSIKEDIANLKDDDNPEEICIA